MSCKVRIVIEGHEPVTKVEGIMKDLQDTLRPGVEICYLTGCLGDPGSADFRIWHFPGENHFQMRARLPELVGECEWVALMEDHNVIDIDWVAAVLKAVDQASPTTNLIQGPVSNLRSTEPWSWASFLFGSALLWAPSPPEPVSPNRFNCAIRRSAMGTERWRVGGFEYAFVPSLASQMEFVPQLVLDHVQRQTMASAVEHHWSNGCAAASLFPGGRSQALEHCKMMVTRRTSVVMEAARAQPTHRLPPLTQARVFALCLAHAAGCYYGLVLGSGKSAWRLE